MWVMTLIMTIFITSHRTLGGGRAPKETGGRECCHRCQGINRALGWAASWGGTPVGVVWHSSRAVLTEVLRLAHYTCEMEMEA